MSDRDEVARLRAENEALRRAARLRATHGHSDTCTFVLRGEQTSNCDCGHDVLLAALAGPAQEGEP